ncbi:MAG: BlaI/MecI/CopY family transcriptional regulator [Armatimonadota bacterium]
MAKRTPRLSRLRTDRRGIELALGDLEAAVMKVIWQAGEPLPVEAVRQALEDEGHKIAYTTVMTTLARLHKKGLLEREMHGRAYHYWAALTEDEFAHTVAESAINSVLGTFSGPAVAYFVEALSERDPRQLDLLAELLERKRNERADG